MYNNNITVTDKMFLWHRLFFCIVYTACQLRKKKKNIQKAGRPWRLPIVRTIKLGTVLVIWLSNPGHTPSAERRFTCPFCCSIDALHSPSEERSLRCPFNFCMQKGGCRLTLGYWTLCVKKVVSTVHSTVLSLWRNKVAQSIPLYSQRNGGGGAELFNT